MVTEEVLEKDTHIKRKTTERKGVKFSRRVI